MKRVILYISTIFILVAGCMRDDLSDCYTCPEDPINLILLFAYPDYDDKKDGSDVFEERIENIDVILYNNDLKSYLHLEITPEELGEERSKELQVDPGDYYIISWANNVLTRSSMPILTQDTIQLGENLIFHNNPTSADPLHYAPDTRNLFSTYSADSNNSTILPVNVPPRGTVTHTLSYMSAHRTLHLYLKDFPDVTEESATNPDINVSNLTLHYNDLLEKSEEYTDYQQKAEQVTKEDETYGYAKFYLPLFEKENNIVVTTKGENRNKPYTYWITMDEILQKLEITELIDGDNLVIEAILEFKGTYIEVKRPTWSVIGIKPSL